MWKKLAVTGVAGALVAIAMTPSVADEQFTLTTVVPIVKPGGEPKVLDAFDISWFDKASHTLSVAASRVTSTASGLSNGEIIVVDTEKNIVTKEIQDPAHPFAGAFRFRAEIRLPGRMG